MCIRDRSYKLEFHDADTDTDILARMSASMPVSASVSWNASYNEFPTGWRPVKKLKSIPAELAKTNDGRPDRRVKYSTAS